MLSDLMRQTLRQEIAEQLTEARRQLRVQEQRLARLKYEWSIAKRLRSQARSEDEREKWRIQSDVYMGLVMQQENIVQDTRALIYQQESRLAELDAPPPDQTAQ